MSPPALLLNDFGQRDRAALALPADISQEADVLRIFTQIDRELGPLTALVNNAGILERQMRVEQMDAARLQRVFASNFPLVRLPWLSMMRRRLLAARMLHGRQCISWRFLPVMTM